jgi:hypothetical protein
MSVEISQNDSSVSHQRTIRWYRPSELLPKHGQTVLIREYYRSAKTGKYTVGYVVFHYNAAFGFKLEEDSYDYLGLKVTHWLPIPPINE